MPASPLCLAMSDRAKQAVPTVGCPANGSSSCVVTVHRTGNVNNTWPTSVDPDDYVHMSTLQSNWSCSGSCRNVVSERLNSRATFCFWSWLRLHDLGTRTMANGLPSYRVLVKTSTMEKSSRRASWSIVEGGDSEWQ